MRLLLVAAFSALLAGGQPEKQPSPADGDKALKAFNLFSEMTKTHVAVANDHCEKGEDLLFFRISLFVHQRAKATPEQAMKAAAIALKIPKISRLAAKMDSGPTERDSGSGSARADKAWLVERDAKLMTRDDIKGASMLMGDTNCPFRVEFA